jgi:thiamine biosynthesis lipoprotein
LRRFREIVFWLLVAAVVGPVRAEPRTYRFTAPSMGTTAALAVVAEDSLVAQGHAQRAFELLASTERLLSNWTTTSEVARWNRELTSGPTRVSSAARPVLTTALRIAEASDGAFDPTVEPLVRLWGFLGGLPAVPPAALLDEARARIGHEALSLEGDRLRAEAPGRTIDLGGIAKGHAVDLVITALHDLGVENALMDLSGNLRGIGTPTGRASWTVGIRDPQTEDAWFARLTLEEDAVATSGNYEQFFAEDGRLYGHVLDPRTGWPVEGLDSVTVLAPTAIEADAWATALLVLGPEAGPRLAAQRDEVSAIFVQVARDGRHVVLVEKDLAERFDIVRSVGDRFDVRWF